MTMSIDPDEGLRAFVASTRPVQLLGDDFLTQLTRSALENMVEQLGQKDIWCYVEHLDFLPPLGRWREAEIREADDGEAELYFIGRRLPQYVAETTPRLSDRISRLPSSTSPPLSVRLEYDRRSFDPKTATSIEQESGGIASPVERRAEIPPLEYWLIIPVVWGATRFLGSFFDQLGQAAGEALTTKIASWTKKSKQPDRSTVFVLDFRLPDGARLSGFVFAAPNEVGSTIAAALRVSGDLATVAGLQKEDEFLPGMKQAAYFFDGEEWQLGWWTDGECVVLTKWFGANIPNVEGVLGQHPLEQ